MSRTLTPLQEAIVTRVTHLERMPEDRLRDYLGSYFRGLDESDEAWCKEFSLALELLVLYGHLRVEDHPRKGRLLIDARRNRPVHPSESVADAQPADPKSSPWPPRASTLSVSTPPRLIGRSRSRAGSKIAPHGARAAGARPGRSCAGCWIVGWDFTAHGSPRPRRAMKPSV